MPTAIKAMPAMSFSVAGETNRVMAEPNTTANKVDRTSALEAARKMVSGRTDVSVAYNMVAICVLSPSSASSTDPKMTSTVFTIGSLVGF